MSPAGHGTTSLPWWALLAPAEAEVCCGEHTHRLRWQNGTLSALDHPDAEGELVLAALGGDRPECVDLIEHWAAHSDDLDVLAAGPRSAADALTLGPDDIPALRGSAAGGLPVFGPGWAGHAPLTAQRGSWSRRMRMQLAMHRARLALSGASYGRIAASGPLRPMAVTQPGTPGGGSYTVRRGRFSAVSQHLSGPPPAIRGVRLHAHGQAQRRGERRAALLSVLALGPEFQFRLSATVAGAWADGGSRASDRAGARPALVAALAGRLAPAAAVWLGIDPGHVEVSLHEDAGWGRLAWSGTGSGRRLHAALPVRWLASVWAAGLAVTAGHLVVAVTGAAWPEATVLGVPEPGAEPVILEVRAGDGGWMPATAGSGNGER